MDMSIELEFYVIMAATAISLAALASLISLFRNAESFNKGDIYIFRALILGCLLLLMGGILPLLLHQMEFLTDEYRRVLLSMLFLVAFGYLVAADIRKMRSGELIIVHSVTAILITLASVLVCILNLINIFTLKINYLYQASLTWGLMVLCIRLYLLFIAATRDILREAEQKK